MHPMFGSISVDEIIHFVWIFLILLAVFGILWGILLYAIPFPDPIKKWVRVVLLVLGGFALIGLLLSAVGHPAVQFSH